MENIGVKWDPAYNSDEIIRAIATSNKDAYCTMVMLADKMDNSFTRRRDLLENDFGIVKSLINTIKNSIQNSSGSVDFISALLEEIAEAYHEIMYNDRIGIDD